MTTPADRHNALVYRFVLRVLGETRSSDEIMVVLESTVAAAMIGAHRLHGVTPQAASALVEAALHRAMERVAEQVSRHG